MRSSPWPCDQGTRSCVRRPASWHGMIAEVCEGAPVTVSGWVLTDRHDLAPCAADSLKGVFGRLHTTGWLLRRDCGLADHEHKSCGPINRSCGGSAGLVGITRAAAHPIRNCSYVHVHRLVTTSLTLIIPLSLPGPRVPISSSTAFSSVQCQRDWSIGACPKSHACSTRVLPSLKRLRLPDWWSRCNCWERIRPPHCLIKCMHD